jgi:ArsR family transcriptional regulator
MTSTNLDSTAIEKRATLFSALGDPIRLQILDQLAPGQQCVCEMQEAIDIASNLLSYHLRVLKDAGLVEAARRGRWIDYQLSEQAAQLVQGSLPSGVR